MKEVPVTFKSKGKQIVGMLHLPGNKKYPAVILCHGFTVTKIGNFGNWLVLLARELAKRNFVVLRFDFRGCGDSEGGHEEFSITTQLEDIDAAFNFLEKVKEADKKRIALAGHSLSGATVIIKASSGIDAKTIISIAPSVYLTRKLTEEEVEEARKKGFLWFRGLKIGYDYIDDLKKYSDSLRFVKKIKKPFLIVHGTSDEYIPVEDVKELFDAANEPKKLISIKDATHYFVSNHLNELVKEMDDWFQKWLK